MFSFASVREMLYTNGAESYASMPQSSCGMLSLPVSQPASADRASSAWEKVSPSETSGQGPTAKTAASSNSSSYAPTFHRFNIVYHDTDPKKTVK